MDIKPTSANALPVAELPVQNTLKSGGKAADKDPVAIKKAAQGFEAMFTGMMLKSMRETVGKEDKLTGGGRGEETFRSLLDQAYADKAAASGSIGLATMIEKQLNRRP